MDFDLHLHISENSATAGFIRRKAESEKITPEQAAERLLEEAAESQPDAHRRRRDVMADPEYIRQVKIRSAKRAEARRTEGDTVTEPRPETPDALIGFLADAPEVAQTIRDLAAERRAKSYGA